MTVAIHVAQQRDESCLGASEAPAVLGLDKYRSPMAVWRRLRGLPVHEKENEAALWGQVLEPVIRGRYVLDRQRTVFVPTRSFGYLGWLRATPDGIVHDVADPTPSVEPMPEWFDMSPEYTGLLQVKTASAYLADEWEGGPPARYEVQCRVEMAVCDLPWCDIVCLIGGQRLVGPFRIERDPVIEREILKRLRSFWDLVQAGVEPTVDHSDAWRMHVSEKLGRSHAVEVAADADMTAAIAQWKHRRDARHAAKREEDEAKNDILLRLSAAGATKVDAGALGKVTAYRTASGTWALRTPWHWRDD